MSDSPQAPVDDNRGIKREPRWGIPPVTVHREMLASELLGETLGWHVIDYNMPIAWQDSKGEGVTVGIVDTGVDERHATVGDLRGVVKANRDFTDSPTAFDGNGHGAHVAGIIAAVLNNGIGIAGVSPAVQLVIGKGLNDRGSGTERSIADALGWVGDQGVDIVNCSWGGPPSDIIIRAIERLVAQGVIVFVAAGNDGGAVSSPANHKGVICVTAVDQNRTIATFSSRGPEVDVGAPGVEIRSTYKNGTFAVLSGTSMSSPWAASITALGMAYDRRMGRPTFKTADEVIDWLTDHSYDAGDPGRDPLYGVGLPKPEDFFKPEPVEPPPEPSEFPVIISDALVDGVPCMETRTYKRLAVA